MRVLIVKLSSMGDVIHALPVVQDIRRSIPGAVIDWVVEPSFAPLVRRATGIGDVIEAPLRRWSRRWWTGSTRSEFRQFRERLKRDRYDAVLDLQGLTKSAWIAHMARGHRFALANRTEGSSYEAPTRWVADTAVPVEPRIHALDRSRVMAASALHYAIDDSAPDFGLRTAPVGSHHPVASIDAGADLGTVAFLHGTSRDDKLWPEAYWLALGRQLIDDGWRLVLPRGSQAEGERAVRLSEALGPRASVWPAMALDDLMNCLGACQGAIGVDSGLSHLAVALDLPHVQIYNFPTAWRTGPLASHGHQHQVALVGDPTPSVDAVLQAWSSVVGGSAGSHPKRDLDIHMSAQAMSQLRDLADDKNREPSGTPSGQPPAPSVA